MALGGRYRTMFDVQASRFGSQEPGAPDGEGEQLDVLT
jgi:hypothetical protein